MLMLCIVQQRREATSMSTVVRFQAQCDGFWRRRELRSKVERGPNSGAGF